LTSQPFCFVTEASPGSLPIFWPSSYGDAGSDENVTGPGLRPRPDPRRQPLSDRPGPGKAFADCHTCTSDRLHPVWGPASPDSGRTHMTLARLLLSALLSGGAAIPTSSQQAPPPSAPVVSPPQGDQRLAEFRAFADDYRRTHKVLSFS
jgi:hypothetical protein